MNFLEAILQGVLNGTIQGATQHPNGSARMIPVNSAHSKIYSRRG